MIGYKSVLAVKSTITPSSPAAIAGRGLPATSASVHNSILVGSLQRIQLNRVSNPIKQGMDF